MITTNKQSDYTYVRRIAGLLIIPVVILAVSCSRKNDVSIKDADLPAINVKTVASALILLDGKAISDEQMKQIPTDSIASINVIKGADAIAKYGDKAKNGAIEIATKKDLPEVTLELIDQAALFPGGTDGWRNYLSRSLQYPEKAQDEGVQGVAKLQFTVHADGSLSNIKVLNEPGAGLGDEALRIVSKGPKWKPAVQNGKYVTSEVIQNITFQLQ